MFNLTPSLHSITSWRLHCRRLTALACIAASALSAFAYTDEQVINYIVYRQSRGDSSAQIAGQLKAKGVKDEDITRIQASLARSGGADVDPSSVASSASGSVVSADENVATTSSSFFKPTFITARAKVYGQDLFNQGSLTFEPNENMATPQNYRLGPGDEVVIDIWGASEDHLRKQISREGSIMIQNIGPVHLNGMTIDEANKHIKEVFANRYSGVGDVTDINLTLGEIRSIQIDVMGELQNPGSFRMSPFSTVFHAIYNAGGINSLGSLRNIHVMRNGKRIANVDIYDYLFDGKQTGNIRLQEGDVIIVPPYSELVTVAGDVKRPMAYELKGNETVADLLRYAGGFKGDAYAGMVRLRRLNGSENELFNIDRDQFASYRLKDGDLVTVGSVIDRYSNRAELKGAVMRPGQFALGSEIVTLTDIINKADGLREDAYKDRVLIYREAPDLTLEVVSVNLNDILNGRADDVTLKPNDVITISSVQDIVERGDFSIIGYVMFPGRYSYTRGTTLEDLILRAGGLLEGASTARIDVSRRIVDPTSVAAIDQLAETFTFSFDSNSADNTVKRFLLQPYDIVQIRRSPAYKAQQQVSVDGEVNFRGTYTLSQRNERVSDLVRRSGGLLSSAYVSGASLSRLMTDDEVTRRNQAIKLAIQNSNPEAKDSISIERLNLTNRYNVGIDLSKAVANPGSTYDIVLKPGDRLFVPERQGTVKISGEVLFPNTVVYEPGQNMKYYISQAGGFNNNAKKNKAYVVYMNGTVSKLDKKTPIQPGCHIIVPSKRDSPELWRTLLTYTSSFTSITTMMATIASLLRR